MGSGAPLILFEDPHLIVLDKPAGMLSQSDVSGVPSLVDWLRAYVGRHYVGLVHRLDRNTSGVMVAAKRSKAAARLSESLLTGELKRYYRVWLNGIVEEAGTWKDYLFKDEASNVVTRSSKERPGAKEAVLHFRRTGIGKWMNRDISLCAIELETGRSHQIRIQGALHGHPVLGDTKYGEYREASWTLRFGRPALHSFRIEFPHPMTKEVLAYEAPLPPDMEKPLRAG